MKPPVFWYSLLLAHLLGQLQPANDNGSAIEPSTRDGRIDSRRSSK
jgi:hypothetical protein